MFCGWQVDRCHFFYLLFCLFATLVLVPSTILGLLPFTWKKGLQGVIEDPFGGALCLVFVLDVFP